MGAAVSTSTNDATTINESITSVIMSNASSCEISAEQLSVFRLENTKGDALISNVGVSQIATLNGVCFQETVNDSEVRNNLRNELTQKAEAANSGLNFGVNVSNTSNITDAVNKVVNSIQMDNIKSCMALATQKSDFTIKDTGGNATITGIKVDQITNAVSKCIQEDANTQTAVNELTAAIDQDAVSKNEGLNLAILAVVAGLVLLILLFGGGKKAIPGKK